ncbi:hypothetical protein C0992_001129 [Termitomyces sp. T32_za158]|nr:hypothetical protein C0992_001129 [Termitomyces sp. T32_za158]
MSQLAPLDPLLDALQDKAWSHLLQLEAQVQITQTSLSHYTSELSTLCQITDTISDSLQVLLECFSAAPAASSPSPTPAPCFSMARPAPPMQRRANIPRPALPDTYNGNCTSGERFLQFCITYI